MLEVLHADASVIRVRELRNRGALRAVEVVRLVVGVVTSEILLYRPDDVAAVEAVIEQMRLASAAHDAHIGAALWLERLYAALDRRPASAAALAALTAPASSPASAPSSDAASP